MAKKTAKQEVGKAKGPVYAGLYQCLNTKEGEKDIYRIARAMIEKQGTLTKSSALRMRGSNSW